MKEKEKAGRSKGEQRKKEWKRRTRKGKEQRKGAAGEEGLEKDLLSGYFMSFLVRASAKQVGFLQMSN